MFKKIVVPLDGSQCSKQAMDVAISLAKAEAAELAICSVVDPIVAGGTTPPSPAIDLLLTETENQGRKLVTKAIEQARSAGVKATGQAFLGVPYDRILHYAKDENADAIVMGTHGRRGIKRLFMGSVAESVLCGSLCPVIVVRERAESPAPIA